MNIEPTDLMAGDTALEQAMTAALDRSPQPEIPANFAARVAAKAATLSQPVSAPRAQYGRRIAFAAAVVLAAALFVLAPHAAPGSNRVGFLTEMVVLAQLCGLGYWLMRTQRETF